MDELAPEVDQVREIRDAAMRLLVRREHSRVELARKLRKDARDPDVIESVLDALCENGLQSDERYVQSFIRRRAAQGYGPERIGMELRQGKLDSALYAPLLRSAEFDWYQRMQAAWHKKFGEQPSGEIRDRQKQIRFLMYRGFASDQIREMLNAD